MCIRTYLEASYHQNLSVKSFEESLDEMLTHNLITSGCAMKIMQKFDQCICTALSKRVKNRLFLKGHLNTYRNCDNVWTLVMNDVEIRDASVLLHVDKIKIVAYGNRRETVFCRGSQKKEAPIVAVADPVTTQRSTTGSIACTKISQLTRLQLCRSEGVQFPVEFVIQFVGAGHFGSVDAENSDQFGSFKKHAHGYEAVVDALRQTGQSYHDVVLGGTDDARAASIRL
nr:unnamed protein product [Spirometra erinaceieuropaei]